MDLKRYITRRILEAIPVFFLVIIINFSLIHLAPGDPTIYLAGENANPEYIESLRRVYGLDEPLHEQLLRYISKVLQGDFGYSFAFNRPVLQIIGERLPATLLLVITAQCIAILVGTLLGTLEAMRRRSKVGAALKIGALSAYSMPVFWAGLMLMLIFAVRLRWFPSSGLTSLTVHLSGVAYVIDVLWHLVLPVSALLTWLIPIYMRVTNASITEVMKEDFIVTARAKGLTERVVFFRHALRNALLPTVTLAGLSLGTSLTGAVLTESIFGYPGMGRLMYESIFFRDYPTLMGIFIIVSICVIVTMLVVDIVYSFLDPRVAYK